VREALAGVMVEVTEKWDVPLMVTRGYPSMSFLHSAAVAIFERAEHDTQTAIAYLGDHDPSGRDIDRAIQQGIGESLLSLEDAPPWPDVEDAPPSPDVDDAYHQEAFGEYATFERVAVTLAQVKNLPPRPTKPKDSRSRKFKGDSVELDAIPPSRLRQLAEQAIERHVDPDRFRVLRVAEQEEREGLERLAASFSDLGPRNGEAT
jgi:hypothetical protein